MKRTFLQYLITFSLIVALSLDMSGYLAGHCSVENSSVCCGCCCCGITDGESEEACCCNDSGTAEFCSCGCCSSPQAPAIPPVRQADDTRTDYQRTLVNKLELPIEEGSLQCENVEDLPVFSLLCPTRRRAILCCWIT